MLNLQNAETQQLSQFTVRGKMLSRVLGILHNFSKRVPTRRSFADCQALDVLIPLLKAEVILYSTKSLLILAYLTDEENNHLIMADKGIFKEYWHVSSLCNSCYTAFQQYFLHWYTSEFLVRV